eukprot:g561.t1
MPKRGRKFDLNARVQCAAWRFGEEWAKAEFGSKWRTATVRGNVAGIVSGGKSYKVKYDGEKKLTLTAARHLLPVGEEDVANSEKRMGRRERGRKRISASRKNAKKTQKKRKKKPVADCLIKSSSLPSAPLRLPDCVEAAEILEASENMARHKIVAEMQHRLLLSYEENLFGVIYNELLAGFNVLLCGVGSKMQVMKHFVKTTLCDDTTAIVEIHGFRQEFDLTNLTTAIENEILDGNVHQSVAACGRTNLSSGSAMSKEQQRLATRAASGLSGGGRRTRLADDALLRNCRSIAARFGNQRDPQELPRSLFIVVHSIDGAALRQPLAQTGLSILASAPNVHVIASIDHINGPLIWSQKTKERFNWLWHDATTWNDFFGEAVYESSRIVASSGGRQSRSVGSSRGIAHVLESVTRNHRDVWKTLAKLQLDHHAKNRKQSRAASSGFGITFHKFYELCVAQMYVRDDRMLKTLLRELIDHAIVSTRSGNDGNTLYEIPHPPEVIERHLADLKTASKSRPKDFAA